MIRWFIYQIVGRRVRKPMQQLHDTAEMVEGPFDGMVIRAGSVDWNVVAFPHRPDCLNNGAVLSVYRWRRGAWRFVGWKRESVECQGK
jgi:hypothetical protein